MFQMMGVFAEFERAMIQERVRAGLARARGEGKRLGRPPIAPALEKRIREALATHGLSAEEPFVDVSSATELLFYLERAASALKRSVSCSRERGETKAALNYH